MDLKTCRWMTRLLYVGCLALAIIALPLDNQILRMGLLGAALALALGMGLQNFPEGAAVALPVYQSGKSKRRAFWTGVLSGAVEPLFGALVVLAAAGIHALMPWLLSFAAGAMLYVVAEELLPRAGGRRGTCGFLVGFLLMMILDVALG